MAKRAAMTKSPVALAKQALHTAKEALPMYSSLYSRHDFSQCPLSAVDATGLESRYTSRYYVWRKRYKRLL